MIFAWHRVVDERGRRWAPCTIYRACKSSGYSRGYVAQRGDTSKFWRTFWGAGLPFALMMQTWHIVSIALTTGIVMELLSPLSAGVFAFQLVVFGTVVGGFMIFCEWRSPEHAKRALLRSGLCPSCAYKLDDITPEPDGCIICPECGGAWRLRSKDGTAV